MPLDDIIKAENQKPKPAAKQQNLKGAENIITKGAPANATVN